MNNTIAFYTDLDGCLISFFLKDIESFRKVSDDFIEVYSYTRKRYDIEESFESFTKTMAEFYRLEKR